MRGFVNGGVGYVGCMERGWRGGALTEYDEGLDDVGGVLGLVEEGLPREVLGSVEKVSREVSIDGWWRDVADAAAETRGVEIGVGLSDLAEG